MVSQQDLIRAAIFRFGMTRDEFAERIAVSRRTLDKWMLPETSTDARTMPSVARKFIEDLLARYRIGFDISPLGIYNRLIFNQTGGASRMAFKSIISAADWVFVVFPVQPFNELIVWRLAAWALTDEGDVAGLISVPGGGPEDKLMGANCRLVTPPPLRGVYKHMSELDQSEKTALTTGKPIKVEV